MAAPLTQEELLAMQTDIQDTKLATGLSGEEQARLVLQNALPEAARSLVQLALHADKESVRMQSTIHILDRGLGRVQDNPPTPVEDPFIQLMADCARTVVYPEHSTDPDLRPVKVQPGELSSDALGNPRGETAIDEELLLDEITSKLRAVESESANHDMAPPDLMIPDNTPEALWDS